MADLSVSKVKMLGNEDRTLSYNLPSSRKSIVTNHKAIMSDQHSCSISLKPVWNKVTSSPHVGRYELTGGYGRRTCSSSISNDMPEYFMNPERVPVPTNAMDRATAMVIGNRVPSRRDPLAITYVLPGGDGIKRAITGSITKTPFRTFPCGNQTLLDNTINSSRNTAKAKLWG